MRDSVSISIPHVVKLKIDKISKKNHCDRSSIVQEALRQYFAQQELQQIRNIMLPKAAKRGVYTDEDVFKQVS